MKRYKLSDVPMNSHAIMEVKHQQIHIYEAVFLNPRKYNILKIYGHSGYQSMVDERKKRKHRVRKRKRKRKDRREGGRAREGR